MEIEKELRTLFLIFGGDGPDAGMSFLDSIERSDKREFNTKETFKQTTDAIEWLFDELDINNRENQPTIEELRELMKNLAPLDSIEN